MQNWRRARIFSVDLLPSNLERSGRDSALIASEVAIEITNVGVKKKMIGELSIYCIRS